MYPQSSCHVYRFLKVVWYCSVSPPTFIAVCMTITSESVKVYSSDCVPPQGSPHSRCRCTPRLVISTCPMCFPRMSRLVCLDFAPSNVYRSDTLTSGILVRAST
eukprot:TRINITY_DN22666_c0_g1_i2.p1 TRINITY_DN22666_c0_g1~~TRINITY_DN22666_c0_g1_i2.p1  ORF type:complete len:104 (-),score=2.65 TRINITY_DN22666_c0_g1_i2:118-429(-)